MTSSRTSKRRKKRPTKLKPNAIRSPFRRIARKAWGAIVAVGVIGGLIVTYFALLPHVEVAAKSVLNSNNPFSVALEITNQSYLTLHEVEQKCELLHATLHGYLVGRTLNANQKLVAHQIAPNHSATSFCNIDLDTPPNMDAEIQVTVRFACWWWQRSEQFRFVYRRGTTGMFWFPTSD